MAELIQVALNDRLEVQDLLLREEWVYGSPTESMMVVRGCRKERLVCAESRREWNVFVELSRLDIKLFKEICILNMEFVRSDTNDRPFSEELA